MRKTSFQLVVTVLLAVLATSLSAQDRPFLRANTGISLPSMKNLSSELNLQGKADLEKGFGFGVSLGRTFLDGTYMLEGNLSVSLYPTIHYSNPYDTFSVNITHYNYSVLLTRRFMVESGSFVPSIGIGIGYGTTNLIRGGGRAGSMTLLVTAGIEHRLKDNILLQLGTLYIRSLKSDTFDNPFISNVGTDAVYKSNGEPLDDRFDSIEFRAGIVVFLLQRDRGK